MQQTLERELEKIIGLGQLKLQLRKWAKGIVMDERRRSLGMNVSRSKRLPHMAFLGNPGTGKTTVARLLAKLLHMVGVLRFEKVVEVQRNDLIGEFIGQTGIITREKIREAEGGILFVDEAYRLVQDKEFKRDFGIEALEEIMSFMDNGRIVVIFAGYPGPMERVIASNEGFRRRVTRQFHFPDYNTEELAALICLQFELQSQHSPTCGLKLGACCTSQAIAELLERKTTPMQLSKLNAGLVDPLLANAKDNLDYRLDPGCCNVEELAVITLKDLEAGLELIPMPNDTEVYGETSVDDLFMTVMTNTEALVKQNTRINSENVEVMRRMTDFQSELVSIMRLLIAQDHSD